MAAFEDARGALGAWRSEAEAVRRHLLLAREGEKLGRRGAAEDVRRLQGEEAQLAARGQAAWSRFTPFLDHKESLRRLEDRYPILLFPLRLETRFKRSGRGAAQLWVRVYPDQCLADSFEPSLTTQEIKNARAFWAGIWRAGDFEAGERAAWRDLASSHGAGRAGWIFRNYKPLNPAERPSKDPAADVVLVIVAEEIPPSETAAFWTGVWRAGGDEAAIVAARSTLVQSVGEGAAARIIDNFRPFYLSEPPPPQRTRQNTTVKVATLLFAPEAEEAARRSSWSSAPRIDLMPDRLVLVGYRGEAIELEVPGAPIRTPLVAGPDPNAPPDRQLAPDGAGGLKIPDEIAWMYDFEKALEAGMAFRVDLTRDQAARGFDRLVVLGVRTSEDAQQGKKSLETLLEHHLHSRAGLEIVSQGTPTNNTESDLSGYTFNGDPGGGFTAFFQDKSLYDVEADPLARRDGQWLADTLGVSHTLAQRIPNAEGADQIEARAMHMALWPGTMGYMMRTMMRPVFDERTIEMTRRFLSRYALGRGAIPAVRIGAQPYGILPVTAFSRISWLEPSRFRDGAEDAWTAYLRRLLGVLRGIEQDWTPLLDRVGHLGKPGADPHQMLLDVLALHPASVEYHPLTAESETHQFHYLSLINLPIALLFLAELKPSKEQAMALLRQFGHTGKEEPEAVSKVHASRQPRLDGPVIDEPPLSETEAIVATAAGKNYIEWLLAAAGANINIIQEESGFDSAPPRALLYLLLRHAMQLAFHLVGARETVRLGLQPSIDRHFVEPSFVHVQTAAVASAPTAIVSESRYALLHDTVAQHANIRLADYISANLHVVDPELTEQVDALGRLARTPTARLERALAEHIDCVSYRLDAWKQGLLHWKLEQMQTANQESGGLFLGAFGWLEDVRPEAKTLSPAKLAAKIDALVTNAGDPPLMRDSANLGFVHAPSLNHATTAAILRNAYQAYGGRMAVDLSSRRVRLALGILEGMRNGQSLGALLGYRFERYLHDSGVAAVHTLMHAIRRQFPLVANKITTTQDNSAALETIAAANVVDGLRLLAHVEQSATKSFPWGVAALPQSAPAAQRNAVDAALAHIRDANDAVADLVLAEGVHQAALGNFDRAAGTLDAFAKGAYPPDMDVIKTPRTGTALVQRCAIHLSASPPVNPAATPLAQAEPALNAWLAERLPSPAIVGCSVAFTDRGTGAPETLYVTQQDLALQPSDLLYQLNVAPEATLRFLDDRILHFIHATRAPQLDARLRIDYTRREDGRIGFFELQPLIDSLRAMVLASRALQPGDLVRQTDARAAEQPPAFIDPAPLAATRDELSTVRLPALQAMIGGLAVGPIDASIAAYAGETMRLALFRLPQTGIGFAYEWRAGAYEALQGKLAALIARWSARLADATTRLNAYDGATGLSDEERRVRLREIDGLVSTAHIFPEPTDLNLHRSDIEAKHAAFADEITALQTIAATRFATLDAFVQALKARVLAPFDAEGLPLADTEAEMERFRGQLIAAGKALEAEIVKRIADVSALLATNPLSVDTVQKAAKRLLGEDFQMLPRFMLAPKQRQETADALAHAQSGQLTRYLRETMGRDFPLDDWLHGIARVRDKMRHWENAIALSEAFGAAAPEPTAIQLPHDVDARWLAMEIPPPAAPGARAIVSDRLLYTAHFPPGFDPAQPMLGFLVDEWTETIPEADETTGVAFHFDRPNSEPPQAWLLALPAVMDGAWSWEELLEAVTDTLKSARRRAIEPDHVANTGYGWFLPATYSAYTFPEISISNYLLRNIDIYATVRS